MDEQPVMVIEDNRDDEFFTLRTLSKANFHNVVVARDGAAALDLLFEAGSQENPLPRFILLDLKLPKMDGLECLLAIRADVRTRDIPVIIVSSSDNERDFSRCRSLRVKGYLNKPLDADELAETLHGIGIIYQT